MWGGICHTRPSSQRKTWVGVIVSLWDFLLRSLGGSPDRTRSRDTADNIAQGATSVGLLDAPAKSSRRKKADAVAEHWWTPLADAPLELEPLEASGYSTQARGLAHILDGYTGGDDLRLPSLPKAAESVLRLLGGRTYEAKRIADVIAQDQVLSAAVLRLANSVLYGGRERIDDLRNAVTRLGAQVLQSLMLQHSMQAAVEQRRGSDRRLANLVWNGSLASAHILRKLAGLVGVNAEEAYLTGLLHDIGNVVVLREAQEQESALRARVNLGAFVWLCREHHQRLGGLIADAWKLPDKLKAVIVNHHQSASAAGRMSKDVALLALADMLKAMLGYAPVCASNIPGSHAVRALGLQDKPAFGAFLDGLPDELSHIQTTF